MTTALVTGANRGLGLATVRALAHAGHTVVLTARDHRRAADAADQLTSTGHDVHALGLDVTSADDITKAAEEVTDRFGHLDVLVNNAGILPEATDGSDRQFANLETFEKTFTTNVFGLVAVTEAFLPALRRSPAGRIVNVSTTMGSLTDQADPDSPFYSMIVPAYQSSKAAVNSITIALAKALAESNIKVTSVCPGFVQTDLTPINREQAPLSADEAARIVVTAATLGDEATSGTFIDRDGAVAW